MYHDDTESREERRERLDRQRDLTARRMGHLSPSYDPDDARKEREISEESETTNDSDTQ